MTYPRAVFCGHLIADVKRFDKEHAYILAESEAEWFEIFLEWMKEEKGQGDE